MIKMIFFLVVFPAGGQKRGIFKNPGVSPSGKKKNALKNSTKSKKTQKRVRPRKKNLNLSGPKFPGFK